ncbi:hypothetical protein DRN67_04315, partial [Candidatus Micrarchaeota archaeon]
MRSDFLLREKPARMLLVLREAPAPPILSKLAQKSGMSFVHASKLLPALLEAGLVSATHSGREKQIRLTQKGQEVATALANLFSALEREGTTTPSVST